MIDLLIGGLITYRLSSLFVSEGGPAGVFENLRNRAGVIPGVSPDDQPNFLAGILSCIWCFSVWGGWLVGLLYVLAGQAPALNSPQLIVWGFGAGLAFSAVAIALHITIGIMQDIRATLAGLIQLFTTIEYESAERSKALRNLQNGNKKNPG